MNPKELKAEFTVTVGNPPVDGIKVSPMSKEMKVGETFKIKATTTPAEADGHVIWTADNEDLIELTVSGKTATVTALEEGTVYVVAQVKDNKELRAETRINITKPIEVKSLEFGEPKISIDAEEYHAVEVKVDPEEAADKLIWSNADEDLIYLVVDESKTRAQLYGYKEGNTQIGVHVDGQEDMVAILDVTVLAKLVEPEKPEETE